MDHSKVDEFAELTLSNPYYECVDGDCADELHSPDNLHWYWDGFYCHDCIYKRWKTTKHKSDLSVTEIIEKTVSLSEYAEQF